MSSNQNAQQVNLGHAVGPGVPSGGTAGQILKKASATNYDTAWEDADKLPAVTNLEADIAAGYNTSTVYQEGDFCTKDTVLYKRNSWGSDTPAAESWTAAHWTAVNAADQIKANRTAIATNTSDIATNASAISGEATARGNADTALSQDIGKLRSDIGIVEDTNTATHTIASGQYVIWKGELYKAKAAIPYGTTLSTSNLDAVSNGIANELNGNMKKVFIGFNQYTAFGTTTAEQMINVSVPDDATIVGCVAQLQSDGIAIADIDYYKPVIRGIKTISKTQIGVITSGAVGAAYPVRVYVFCV